MGLLGIVGAQHTKKDAKAESGWKAFVGTIVNWKTVLFGAVSAGTFLALGGICYLM